MGRDVGRGLRHVAAATTNVVLVCRKCSKKLNGGFGLDGAERLARELRRRQASHRKPRRSRTVVVEVGCLDVCPKGGVVVLHAGRPDDWLVVPRGTALDDVERHLGLASTETAA